MPGIWHVVSICVDWHSTLRFRFRIELGGRVLRLLRTLAEDLADC